jgi:hypothetical protein
VDRKSTDNEPIVDKHGRNNLIKTPINLIKKLQAVEKLETENRNSILKHKKEI